jgi:hypothetical protein
MATEADMSRQATRAVPTGVARARTATLVRRAKASLQAEKLFERKSKSRQAKGPVGSFDPQARLSGRRTLAENIMSLVEGRAHDPHKLSKEEIYQLRAVGIDVTTLGKTEERNEKAEWLHGVVQKAAVVRREMGLTDRELNLVNRLTANDRKVVLLQKPVIPTGIQSRRLYRERRELKPVLFTNPTNAQQPFRPGMSLRPRQDVQRTKSFMGRRVHSPRSGKGAVAGSSSRARVSSLAAFHQIGEAGQGLATGWAQAYAQKERWLARTANAPEAQTDRGSSRRAVSARAAVRPRRPGETPRLDHCVGVTTTTDIFIPPARSTSASARPSTSGGGGGGGNAWGGDSRPGTGEVVLLPSSQDLPPPTTRWKHAPRPPTAPQPPPARPTPPPAGRQGDTGAAPAWEAGIGTLESAWGQVQAAYARAAQQRWGGGSRGWSEAIARRQELQEEAEAEAAETWARLIVPRLGEIDARKPQSRVQRQLRAARKEARRMARADEEFERGLAQEARRCARCCCCCCCCCCCRVVRAAVVLSSLSSPPRLRCAALLATTGCSRTSRTSSTRTLSAGSCASRARAHSRPGRSRR